MSIFEFISVAISIILGLGVTRLLSNAIELVRARSRVKLHWVPLLWALAVLIIHFQFWWAFFGVSGYGPVRNVDFLVWILTALALFVAGSFILPVRYESERTDLFEHFLAEGRIGVGALGAYIIMASVINMMLGAPWLSLPNLVSLVWLVGVVLTILSRSERGVGRGAADRTG